MMSLPATSATVLSLRLPETTAVVVLASKLAVLERAKAFLVWPVAPMASDWVAWPALRWMSWPALATNAPSALAMLPALRFRSLPAAMRTLPVPRMAEPMSRLWRSTRAALWRPPANSMARLLDSVRVPRLTSRPAPTATEPALAIAAPIRLTSRPAEAINTPPGWLT